MSQFEPASSATPRSRARCWRSGTAYRCFSTQEEIEAFREAARGRGPPAAVPHRPGATAGARELARGAPYVVRLKAPREGETVVDDRVQGDVTIRNERDTRRHVILLRSDGTPTYMLAVVVDDHDMGVTHVIRGDDHLTNAARQTLIYHAMGWEVPACAHIPLIHGPDGKKLSKRHGALGVEAYRDMGYPAGGDAQLPRAARLEPRRRRVLHDRAGDRLVRPRRDLGKAPARLDFTKLDHLSGQHIRAMEDGDAAARRSRHFSHRNRTTGAGPP